MNFEFATTTRIIFGNGTLSRLGAEVAQVARRVLLITGGNPSRIQSVLHTLDSAGLACAVFSVSGEPTLTEALEGRERALAHQAQAVVAVGGGSVLDAGKAIAALATNRQHPLAYLEVIGQGQPLTERPLPFFAVPTTAGTGAEVTHNAVLKSPDHQRKVSLRDRKMSPIVALIDPTLTHSLPPSITASSGMDALTQVIEPYVSVSANPLTDALALHGVGIIARSIRQAYTHGTDEDARRDMALGSLIGGIALSNAKLGAVHGFAGVLGGMFPAPHGAICAILLPAVMQANIATLTAQDHPTRHKFTHLAQAILQRPDLTDLVEWVRGLVQDFDIPLLSAYGVTEADFDEIINQSLHASSMKGNPVPLERATLFHILAQATYGER
ncbi:MAG: iron-containing alcohol dehydrogenase [Phototrophicaceae bacterium]